MFIKLSEKITYHLIKRHVIEADSREIYQYGMEQLLLSLLNIAMIFFVGIVYGSLRQCVIFTIAFWLLRPYAGGYHAATQKRCAGLTLLVMITVLSVMKFIRIDKFICLGLLVMSGVIILLLSPVGTKNKPLDKIERAVYRRKTVWIWCLEFLCALIFWGIKYLEISECIMLVHVVLACTLIAGKMRNAKCA